MFPSCSLWIAAQAKGSPNLHLKPDMKIGLVPTAVFGLLSLPRVNPDQAGGGTLITIQSVQPGKSLTLSWRRTTIREQPTPEPEGIQEQPSPPKQEIVRETGTYTTTGLADSDRILLPFYWKIGSQTTDTSLIWLSQKALRELKQTRRTRWSADFLTKLSNLPLHVVQKIEQKTQGKTLYLRAERYYTTFDLRVNGRKSRLKVIRAHDDFGNEYLILPDEGNPLIVWFKFQAVSSGAVVLDALIWTVIKALASGYRVVEIQG